MKKQIMTVGKRIRAIRMFRTMTQKELGEKLGYKSSPTIRIAQYESGKRSPHKEPIKAFAEALDVSFDAIDVAPINDSTKLMHTLFAMEDFFDLKIKEVDHKAYLTFDSEELEELLSEWLKMYNSYKNGDISEYEYKEWEYKFCKRK